MPRKYLLLLVLPTLAQTVQYFLCVFSCHVEAIFFLKYIHISNTVCKQQRTSWTKFHISAITDGNHSKYSKFSVVSSIYVSVCGKHQVYLFSKVFYLYTSPNKCYIIIEYIDNICTDDNPLLTRRMHQDRKFC